MPIVAPQRILIIRLKVIGDVVLTLPAVNDLRANFPSAKISFLTSKENAALLRGFQAVDEVLVLDRAALRSGNPLRVVPEFFGLLHRLRRPHFDLVVDLQGYGETAWLTRITGAPQRWGRPAKPGRKWAYTSSLTSTSEAHPVVGHLELLRHCGLPEYPVRNDFILPADALATAREFFAAQKLNPLHPTLFIQPFTSGAHKNWPLENYLAIARHWRSQGIQIVLGGGPGDRAALEPARQAGFAISAGTPLLVTGGIIQLSTLVLGGDTGMLHLAVALGCRVMMLMHAANADSPIPFQHLDWVIKAPKPEAIAQIPLAEVNAAIAPIFNPPAGNVSC